MAAVNPSDHDAGQSQATAYGESFADVYDEWYDNVTDAEATADFVASEAGTGPVLELGVGTGRLARPLMERGLKVIGLDASSAMLAQCLDPARGPGPALVQGDMAALPFHGAFGAALIAFNTLFNLPSPELQRTFFQQLAPLLAPDGVLVVETMNTASLAAGPRRSLALSRRHGDGVTMVATNLDPDRQTILGQHLEVRSDGVRRRPWLLRWSAADEIDSHAAEAGLGLSDRFSGWDRRPSGDDDETHITVYRHAAARYHD